MPPKGRKKKKERPLQPWEIAMMHAGQAHALEQAELSAAASHSAEMARVAAEHTRDLDEAETRRIRTGRRAFAAGQEFELAVGTQPPEWTFDVHELISDKGTTTMKPGQTQFWDEDKKDLIPGTFINRKYSNLDKAIEDISDVGATFPRVTRSTTKRPTPRRKLAVSVQGLADAARFLPSGETISLDQPRVTYEKDNTSPDYRVSIKKGAAGRNRDAAIFKALYGTIPKLEHGTPVRTSSGAVLATGILSPPRTLETKRT